MTGRAARQLDPSSPTGRTRRWIPFWVVQAVEIAIAVVFVDVSIHLSNPGLLVGAALAFFALAVTAHGPLGIARICSQPLHLVLAMVVAAVVAVAPVLPSLRPDIEGIIVLEFGAVGLFRVCMLTQAAPVSAGTRRGTVRRRGPAVIDATATVVDAHATRPAPAPPTPPAPPDTAGSPSYDAAARWVGRTSGAAAAVGKQTAARYGPTARARVKKTIRSAGRLTGSVVSPPTDQGDRPGS
jgi:hypothetical protein